MPKDEPEYPRSEPEIIPPDRAHDDDMHRGMRGWGFGAGEGYQRVYVKQIGPFSIFLLALAGGAIAILLLLFIVGAFLIWIPIVGLLVAAAILSSMLRSFFHPWR